MSTNVASLLRLTGFNGTPDGQKSKECGLGFWIPMMAWCIHALTNLSGTLFLTCTCKDAKVGNLFMLQNNGMDLLD